MLLTEKEITVLQMRNKGLTQVEVATRLGISQAAVSGFEKNAKRKLQDAQETLLRAKELGLIETTKGVRK